ncbi:MAG: cysteine protease [Armatimonadetes bacterium CG_4_10_14_3_um_filter_66_18]|nr:VCBS repeat-containing protein [Armatimonadota bacterium]OIO94585.1 MAG: hypothetical protein AUJ96_28385 [Armatimonadetes bacterium CG2_30_66_41]PIU92736.1 MAG: cysteine protease [Armatimonadetes bacterium CG06_land_8_20_14_3_00_66_21]PIY50823.1 MAG: cysteine protease [Armatimonadetes bacterium CG_4_10_14_3_um_filter_66_18]PIZ31202.1 MAG: cysteine protease [Armatimonadetes bacterium CG_4_10_14_0_8_um_filter_66_14]PJB63952.1 MAG: cysteine protease [Armatimonadetes bacterium CG_4_9_14_3_um_f
MRHPFLLSLLVALPVAVCLAEQAVPTFTKLQLTDKFYCEGAASADFNKDGKLDVVSGPFWYEGPGFQTKHEVRPAQAFDPANYSDNFLTFTGDFNGDGWADIFYAPFPGEAGFWYENPADKEAAWKQHAAFEPVDNESPMMGDLNGDGRPDLIFNANGCLGYATYDPAKPDEPWTFHPVTPKADYQRFTHGIGFGDVNGDGRNDLLEAGGWWEQPADAKPGELWTKHPFRFAAAACQMYLYEVDGDGRNDVITVWHCHQYGLVWWKQVPDTAGGIGWEQQVILAPQPDLASPALRVSQLHAMELVDMNGDGLKDILIGKRFWSHGPKGDVEAAAPAVVYWFELRRDPAKGVEFVPHLIDDNSGVGTQVAAADLNGDGTPDVIVGNKKGTFVHLSQPGR